MKKKIKIKEGDLFAIPLRNGGYALGIINRMHGEMTMGYFFDKVYPNVPAEVDASDIKSWKVILIGKFSSAGIENGEWPLLVTNFAFDRDDWPVPILKMQDPLTDIYYAVVYDETLLNDKRYRISKEEADKLYGDGYYGYGAVEKRLTALLADKTSNS